jgi:putative peptidoglycan lipid II flippase
VNESTTDANRQIARAAGTVMLALVIGQVAGLVRSILVARAFGAGPELDAFFAANRVPDTIFALLAGGALSSAFIPTFTALLAKDDQRSAWRLASAVANLLVLILSLLAALAAIFAPQIVRYALASGFSTKDPALVTLTVNLLRIQLVAAVFFGLGGLVMGILNSHQIFLIPALTPSMYQLGLIFGVLVLSPRMGIYGLAYGVVLGAALYLLLQIPSLLKLIPHPYRPSPFGDTVDTSPIAKRRGRLGGGLGLGNPAVGEVIRLMGPRLLGVGVVYLNFWVNTWLASFMPAGSVTGISFGFALMLMAQTAIAQSIATAAMPTFARQYALGKTDEIRASLAAALRGVLLLSLPASLGLILLRTPIITAIYQHGNFDARSTQLVAWALLWYAAGLVGHSLLEVLARAFYAMHDTKTPVLVGAAAMSLNVGLSFTFSALFTHLGWMPHGGLALANSLATALEAAALFVLMRKRLKGIEGMQVARGFSQFAQVTLLMSLALVAWMQIASQYPAWLVALGGVAVGGVVYGLGVWALRVPEIHSLSHAIRSKFIRPHSG